MNNSILEDTDVYNLTDSEFRAWVYILSQASKKRCPTVTIDFDYSERVCRVPPKSLVSFVKKFSMKSILSESGQHLASIRPDADHDLASTLHTNITNNTHNLASIWPDKLVFDFESLYKKYPLKKGKSRGLKVCEKEIKTQEEFISLQKAIDKYASDLVLRNTETQYIKHFSTFMNEWRDWAQDDAGSVSPTIRQKKEFNPYNGIVKD